MTDKTQIGPNFRAASEAVWQELDAQAKRISILAEALEFSLHTHMEIASEYEPQTTEHQMSASAIRKINAALKVVKP